MYTTKRRMPSEWIRTARLELSTSTSNQHSRSGQRFHGEHTQALFEATERVEAVTSNLANAALGLLDKDDVILGAIPSLESANRYLHAAGLAG